MAAQKIDDDAMAWVIRVGDPAFEDWDAYTAWLEANPAHAGRYDAAAAALADAERDVAALPVQGVLGITVDTPPFVPAARPRYKHWIGSAVAASIAGLFGVGIWTMRPQPYTIETAPGEQRTITLADGSEVFLGGGSRLRLDRPSARLATVERGQMLFRIRHDAAKPFHVVVGGIGVTDVGTVFDVKLAGTVTRVAVAKGAVLVDLRGTAFRLDPGQAVVATGAALEREQADDVGGWRTGRLTFDDATLAEIASDLSRNFRHRVTVAPKIALQKRRVTLDIRDLQDQPALLGRLLDVRVAVHADGWTLEGQR